MPFAAALIVLSTIAGQIVQDGMLGPLVASALDQNGTSSLIAGLLLASPWLAIAAFAKPTSIAHRKFGAAACMVGGSLTCAFSFILFMIFSGPAAWTLISLLIGMTMSVRWISGEAWVLEVTPPNRQKNVIGIQETLVGIAGVGGPAILAVVGTTGSLPFLTCGMIMLISAAAAVWASRAATTADTAPMEIAGPISEHKSRSAIILAAAGGALESSIHSFLPVAAAEFQSFSPLFLASIYSAGGTAFQYIFCRLPTRFHGPKLAYWIYPAIMLLSIVAPALPEAPLTIIIFLIGALCGSMYTLATILIAEQSYDYATGIASIAISSTAGSALGPIIMGATLAYDPGITGLSMGTVLIVSICILAHLTAQRTSG